MSDTPDNTAPVSTTDFGKPNADWLTPELVKDYLLANPEFFARYPLLSEELKIPHQKKGSISLVELQAEQLREKVAELQKKLSELMSVARLNEGIYRIYADLNLNLFHCKTLEDIKAALIKSVCKELQLKKVVLHLFNGDDAMPQAARDAIIDKRLSKSDFFFGRLTQEENPLLFGEETAVEDDAALDEKTSQPKSVVIMRLKHHEEIGLLAIGSDDEGHFYPGMDTLLITQLQQFLSLLIPKVQG